MTEKAQNFQSELKALILKYKPEIRIDDTDYQDDRIEQILFVVDDVSVSQEKKLGDEFWNFGDGVVNINKETILIK